MLVAFFFFFFYQSILAVSCFICVFPVWYWISIILILDYKLIKNANFVSFNCFLKNERWVTLKKIDSSQAEVKHDLRARILSKPSSSPVSNTFKPSLNSPNLLKHRSNTPLVAHDEIEPKKSIAACNGKKWGIMGQIKPVNCTVYQLFGHLCPILFQAV